MRIEPLPYDPRLAFSLPAWVIENIQAVSAYMKNRGHEDWTIAGVRSQSAHAREIESLRQRVAAAEAAGRRVIAAFEAHGKAKGVVDDLSTRAECERAMVALDAAISAESADTRSGRDG